MLNKQALFQFQMPSTEQEWKTIAKVFQDTWNFPHCLGALDGKHVQIQCPANMGSTFYNYKGTHSIVLMAAVDANYNFIYAHVGCQGRISDGGVFKITALSKKMDSNSLSIPVPELVERSNALLPYVFVADEAFALKINLMKPFSGALEQSPNRVFNYRLSRSRRVVENAFGLLSATFRVFRKPLLLNLENAEKVVTCSLYLYNFLRKSGSLQLRPGTFDCETADGRIIPGLWRSETEGDTGMTDLCQVPFNSTNTAIAVREAFKEYFISDAGKVPWQDQYQ